MYSVAKVDQNNIFSINLDSISIRYSPQCQKFNCVQRETKKNYEAYALRFLSNPKLLIYDGFKIIVGQSKGDYYQNQLFCEFLILKVFPSLYFMEQQQELFLEIFGEQRIKNQKISIFFHEIYHLYKRFLNGVSLNEVKSEIEKKYPPYQFNDSFVFREKQLLPYIKWFVRENLFVRWEIISRRTKLQTLQILDKKLEEKLYFTLKKKPILDHEQEVFLIMIEKGINSRYISVDELINCKKFKSSEMPISGIQFALKISYQLLFFEETFGENYPSFSPENIKYDYNTKKIDLLLFPLVMNAVGLRKTVNTVETILVRKLEKKQYWLAEQQITENKKNISDQTLLWNYLVIVDIFERGYSQFEQSNSKLDLFSHVTRVVEAIENGIEQRYFSTTVCFIIQCLKKKGFKKWKQEKSRPSIKNLHEVYLSLFPQEELQFIKIFNVSEFLKMIPDTIRKKDILVMNLISQTLDHLTNFLGQIKKNNLEKEELFKQLICRKKQLQTEQFKGENLLEILASLKHVLQGQGEKQLSEKLQKNIKMINQKCINYEMMRNFLQGPYSSNILTQISKAIEFKTKF